MKQWPKQHGKYFLPPVPSWFMWPFHKCLLNLAPLVCIKGTQGLIWHRTRHPTWERQRLSWGQFWSMGTEHRLCLCQTFLSITFQNLLKAAQHVLQPIHHDDPLSCQVRWIKPSAACSLSDSRALILQFLKEMQGLLGLVAEFNLFVYHESRRPVYFLKRDRFWNDTLEC